MSADLPALDAAVIEAATRWYKEWQGDKSERDILAATALDHAVERREKALRPAPPLQSRWTVVTEHRAPRLGDQWVDIVGSPYVRTYDGLQIVGPCAVVVSWEPQS